MLWRPEIQEPKVSERLNAWLEKWTDQQERQTLVRIRILRTGEDAPFEVILALPTRKLPT